MGDVQVDAQDVIRLMLQFCKENNLRHSFQVLQTETQVSLNTVDNLKSFVNDIIKGRWDSVLGQIQHMSLPKGKLINLYEQVVVELCEMRELDTAKIVLSETPCLAELKNLEPERYATMMRLVSSAQFDETLAYGNTSREQRRLAIASALRDEVKVVPPARLQSLIGQALQYQQQQGHLVPSEMAQFDLFTGKTTSSFQAELGSSIEESYPTARLSTIKFGKKVYASSAAFSPKNEYFATGSIDGFVEIWNYQTGKLNTELKYQAEDKIMMHDDAVLCLCFNPTGEILASGSQDGIIKIWNVSTGECIRRIDRAHSSGVSCICFSSDSTQVLSGSHDSTIRIHGLHSGKVLKTFSGHQSFVNSVLFTPDMNQIVSGSSDATVKIWDVKTMECVATFFPDELQAKKVAHHAPIHNVLLLPGTSDQLVICSACPTIHITNLKGELLKGISFNSVNATDFVHCTASPKGHYIHTVGEDHVLYSFNVSTGKLDHSMTVHKKYVVGIVHHPSQNFIATMSKDGTVGIWKSDQ